MRWKPRPYIAPPSDGDFRVVKRFLIFPLRLSYPPRNSLLFNKGREEYRWWEKVSIYQRYIQSNILGDGWRDWYWANE